MAVSQVLLEAATTSAPPLMLSAHFASGVTNLWRAMHREIEQIEREREVERERVVAEEV